MLGENTQTVRENTEILLEASKAIGLEVNPEKTKYMIMSRDGNIVRNGNINIGDLSFEEVENSNILEQHAAGEAVFDCVPPTPEPRSSGEGRQPTLNVYTDSINGDHKTSTEHPTRITPQRRSTRSRNHGVHIRHHQHYFRLMYYNPVLQEEAVFHCVAQTSQPRSPGDG
ncbi:hypothetical protein ANN_23053 [Periplaneta americana]|uniref:Reverse transcriptase domain-containing protein n=1 Tax=Periplaneta americana TaxID=6978 RepID=A0ABQ8SL09_PERAM|nr:hypothetical protein ANN_23053 [Periplaneta americana]